MKNENRTVKFAIFVLFITMVALILVAGTYAKYTTSVTLSDTATVAKWSIEVNDTNVVTVANPTVTFDLFKTINDTTDGNDEKEVADTKIAPGTTGSFDIKIENLSEVVATYDIAFEVTGAKEPLQFKVGDSTTWGDLSTVSAKANLAAGTGTETVTVQWQWPFETGADDTAKKTNNDADTVLGKAGETVTVTATITASQVD